MSEVVPSFLGYSNILECLKILYPEDELITVLLPEGLKALKRDRSARRSAIVQNDLSLVEKCHCLQAEAVSAVMPCMA